MRSIVKHIMIAALFAVAMLGGSELPILHAPQFAEAHAFEHAHMDAGLEQHAHPTQPDPATADHNDQQPGSDHGCTHVHAHCCAATAILVAGNAPPLPIDLGGMRIERNAALPYGQLSRPLLRPPRLVA